MKLLSCVLMFFAGLFLVIAPVSAQNAPMLLPVDAQVLTIISGDTKHEFALEIADTAQSRASGLMNRKDFPADRAMIFVFDPVQPVMMWMANTPLPLDMLFVSRNGEITHIAEDTTPFSEAIVSSQAPVGYVVELNAGTVAKLGIKTGDKLQHRIICGSCS